MRNLDPTGTKEIEAMVQIGWCDFGKVGTEFRWQLRWGNTQRYRNHRLAVPAECLK
jgi:hypothetical protein